MQCVCVSVCAVCVRTCVCVTTHYGDVIMGTMASQITSLIIVYSAVYSAADQRKHQSSASLAFVRGIHRGPVNSPHKWPVTRKMFPFDDFIMHKYAWTSLMSLALGQLWRFPGSVSWHRHGFGKRGSFSAVICRKLELTQQGKYLVFCIVLPPLQRILSYTKTQQVCTLRTATNSGNAAKCKRYVFIPQGGRILQNCHLTGTQCNNKVKVKVKECFIVAITSWHCYNIVCRLFQQLCTPPPPRNGKHWTYNTPRDINLLLHKIMDH